MSSVASLSTMTPYINPTKSGISTLNGETLHYTVTSSIITAAGAAVIAVPAFSLSLFSIMIVRSSIIVTAVLAPVIDYCCFITINYCLSLLLLSSSLLS